MRGRRGRPIACRRPSAGFVKSRRSRTGEPGNLRSRTMRPAPRRAGFPHVANHRPRRSGARNSKRSRRYNFRWAPDGGIISREPAAAQNMPQDFFRSVGALRISRACVRSVSPRAPRSARPMPGAPHPAPLTRVHLLPQGEKGRARRSLPSPLAGEGGSPKARRMRGRRNRRYSPAPPRPRWSSARR